MPPRIPPEIVPRELEERPFFTQRYITEAKVRDLSLTYVAALAMANASWESAKMRSQVSIKTSGGEWLMF